MQQDTKPPTRNVQACCIYISIKLTELKRSHLAKFHYTPRSVHTHSTSRQVLGKAAQIHCHSALTLPALRGLGLSAAFTLFSFHPTYQETQLWPVVDKISIGINGVGFRQIFGDQSHDIGHL